MCSLILPEYSPESITWRVKLCKMILLKKNNKNFKRNCATNFLLMTGVPWTLT